MRLAGDSGSRAVLILLVVVGSLSAFINNTAVLAVFLPISLTLARQYDVSPTHLLMPMSFVTMFGGSCTLVGTSTNLIVSGISADHGLGELPMFELGKLGIVFFVVGLAYVTLVAPRILRRRRSTLPLTRKYHLSNYLSGVIVGDQSPLIGRTPAEARLNRRYDVTILQIIRDDERRWFGLRDTRLMAGDRLLVRGDISDILRMNEMEGLSTPAELKFADEDLSSEVTALAEGVISPTSSLIGRTLKEADFRHKYGVFALAIRKHGRTIRNKIANIRLEVGDTLLLQGRRSIMDALAEDPDFLMMREVEIPKVRTTHAVYAVTIMGVVVGLTAFGVLPILVSSIIGCVLMIATGCLTAKEAVESIDWMVIFLLAGLIPLGIAMEDTGTAHFLASKILQVAESFGPNVVVSLLYLVTAIMTAILSNNATAILLAPIALDAAAVMGVSPWPMLVAIAFGASAAFSTPVGYQTNLMVYGPGGYRYMDFVRVGVPLTILFWIIASLLIPVVWPLYS